MEQESLFGFLFEMELFAEKAEENKEFGCLENESIWFSNAPTFYLALVGCG